MPKGKNVPWAFVFVAFRKAKEKRSGFQEEELPGVKRLKRYRSRELSAR
jgi:hypothetical protein